MAKVYLGLGTNLGHKQENLEKALDILGSHQGFRVLKISSFYETDPVGYEEQDKFLNAVVVGETLLSPYELLDFCHEIENALKRVRSIRWGPRTIDVDILMYDSLEIMDEPLLIIPHPRMVEREFVLEPLAEIAPEAVHPGTGKSIAVLLRELKKIS
ncbi:2-amino-4-hydroxy-6-hydroxymethyldihydropteridine diphosphokinase [Candidatus Contubernalis alkaliaceticus]|uniref:2-amino-4-hydroxy-6- hydroxymethyldihydropteridine diphosphokinase n=1 Tax=Candidatus Contubernalis alkaliaceticus TaxID=338645 RepID=UPI001F4C0515|nr:2-amino-4-hydroxy-6-hydroxymethyldihydropteridine diphosphokinase [Candidatus Contubernalis alkalaceticus]UNC92960.1 2-amino-4-hydroxy-6-hydroxymethyldihydropteridine diphosphokinase [Candidatus Contubernalis alkalaceticus]